MFFILIFASGGISSGSLYKDRQTFKLKANASFITSSFLCVGEITHVVIIENRCRFFGG